MLIAPSQTKRGGAELLPLFPRKRALQVGEEVFEDLPCLFRAPSLFLVSAFISGCRDNITKKKCLLSVAWTNAHEWCRDRKTMQIVVVL